MNDTTVWIIDLASIEAATPQNELSNKAQEIASVAYGFLKPANVKLLSARLNDATNSVEWPDTRRLRKLFESIQSVGSFGGILFVVLPDASRSFTEFLTTCQPWLLSFWETVVDNSMVSNAQSLDQMFRFPWPSKTTGLSSNEVWTESAEVAFLRLLVMSKLMAGNGRTIFFSQPPEDDEIHSITAKTWGFDVEWTESRENIRSYCLTAIGREIFRFAPMFGDNASSRFLSESPFTEDWRSLSSILIKDHYYDWARQEFGSRQVSQLFLWACWKSICGMESNNPEHRLSCLPWECQIAMGALRVTRRMATWTLEGAPFECVVVLMPEDDVASLGQASSRISKLIEICPPVPFNFTHIEEVRKHTELAQGRGLFLVVSAGDGRLRCVGTCASSPTQDMSREFYSWLAGNNSLVFDIPAWGNVDVYVQNQPLLSYDGFEWKLDPLRQLGLMFQEHFCNLNQRATDCAERLLEATTQMLSRHESSIYVLLGAADRATADEETKESLRPNIRWASTRVEIDGLDAKTLASLLHLDGAHFISNRGEVRSVSRRISAASYRHEIPITDSQYREWESVQSQLSEPQPCVLMKSDIQEYGKIVEQDFLCFSRRIDSELVAELKTALQKIYESTTNVAQGLFELVKREFRQELTKIPLARLRSGATESEIRGAIQQYRAYRRDIILRMANSDGSTSLLFPTVSKSDEYLVEGFVESFVPKPESVFESFEFGFFRIEEFPYDFHRFDTTVLKKGLTYFAEREAVVVDESRLDDVINNVEVDEIVRQRFNSWGTHGDRALSGSPGTGTRSAKELSRMIRHSIVVKVSASGSVSAYQRGVKLDLESTASQITGIESSRLFEQ